jgi:hypothetical protein
MTRLTIYRSVVTRTGEITQESTVEIPFTYTSRLFHFMEARSRGYYTNFMKARIAVNPSPVRYLLEQLPGGWTTAITILRHVVVDYKNSECEEAKILNVWEEVVSIRGKDATCEEIAEAAGMSPSHMFGLIAEAAHLQGFNVAKLVKAMAIGEIMERGVREALKPSGFQDRKAILQSAGLYPAPPGTNISVEANAQAGTKLDQNLEAASNIDEFERDTLESTEFLRGVGQHAEPKSLESPASFIQSTPEADA